MTKDAMKLQYDRLEKEIEHLSEESMQIKLFINGDDFKGLSDLEATLAVTQHHMLESYARVLMMRAALFGGRLQDPDGTKTTVNDETPNPIVTEPPRPEVQTGRSVRVGDTVITEG